MLRVVAQNLAENAIRYAGPGATFTLASSATATASSSRTDDGIGVDEADPPRLFERFYRADRAVPRVARARARDREAHRHAGGRARSRRAGGSGRGLEVRCVAPAGAVSAFTGSSPDVHQAAPPHGGRPVTLAGGRDSASARDSDETTCRTGSPSVAQAVAADGRGLETVFDVDDLAVSYSGNVALKDVTLDIRKNFVTAFIGPSGCGKSTFIRCFNRMNDLIPGAKVDGQVLYHGRDLYALEVDPVEVRRRIGMVFQKPNPFPKSIYDNIAFGPRVLGMKKDLDGASSAPCGRRRSGTR